jgi:hypothetical protein
MFGLLSLGSVVANHQPTGHETERDPYCEPAYADHPAQPSIGYGRAALPGNPDLNAEVPVSGSDHVRESTCEGEQWDGQDPYAKNFANSTANPTTPCTGQDVVPASARYNLAVFQCADPDKLPINDPTKPVGVRVSAQGDNDRVDRGYAYVFVRIFAVGRTGVFLEGCRSPTGPGAIGNPGGVKDFTPDSACDDGTNGHHDATWLGRGTLAWYGQDDTPLNVLATAISVARVTQGKAGDGDCTQAEYHFSDPVTPTCTRDNTAITVDLLG